jgi:aryl-alcohol dehydrogenase-like predicted oxidoreductase
METRTLGRSIAIAPLVLGGNVFGWTADSTTSFAILDRFADAGFQAIDTADVYSAWAPGNSGGESERIIGDWMASRGNRSRTVVITKVGSDLGGGKKGLSAAYIAQAVEESLRRLRTDYIDVYLTHWPDPSVPYAETLGAFQRLLEAGTVREIGASNLDAAQLHDALEVARRQRLPRFAVLEPEYNLMDRASFEGALRDLVMEENISVITYFSLAKGFLTGKYRSADDLSQSPRGASVKGYLDQGGTRVLQALDDIAATHRATPAAISLAWLMARPGVTAPIASATSLQQLDGLVQAATVRLSSGELAALTSAGER